MKQNKIFCLVFLITNFCTVAMKEELIFYVRHWHNPKQTTITCKKIGLQEEYILFIRDERKHFRTKFPEEFFETGVPVKIAKLLEQEANLARNNDNQPVGPY